MSGRGYGRGPRGQARGQGRGRTSPEAHAKVDREPKFKGSNPELPSLNFGASLKESRPIEFLQTMGEHAAIHYKPSICRAFWSNPPQYGDEDEEPLLLDDIPAGNLGNAILSEYQNDHKDWKVESKKIRENKMAVFALVYSQLSESSRGEVQDDEDWTEAYMERDLLFLIARIRATHIARQSGNPGQNKERVQMAWSNLRMQTNETSFVFRKKVEDHQLERLAVGLPLIPEEELVVGVLNRLDMSRYAQLVRDYFDNERRGIAELPAVSSTLWREVKDAQVLRFRGTGGGGLESVYLSRADEINVDGGRGRGRGGRTGRGGRGGRGRGRAPQEEKGPAEAKTSKNPPSPPSGPITPSEIICWTCGKKGHRSTSCSTKRVNFTNVDEDVTIYFTTYDCSPVLLTKIPEEPDTIILLDTQASIHLLHDPSVVTDIHTSATPITVQGITGERMRVTMEATIKDIGLRGYYCTNTTANIISYHKLKDTHDVHYDNETDMFTAVPDSGPTLTFVCVDGHYMMNLTTVTNAYAIYVTNSTAKYSAKQLAGSRRAYEFMQRMGYISYKAAAEIIQRGSMQEIPFTRADLVAVQNIYGTPAAYQLGQGTQQQTKTREDDRIPVHEAVNQKLQIDLFNFLGQTFFFSISVVTHLGPGTEKLTTGSCQTDGSRAQAGKALLLHM